jgi:hypothetical protein
VGCKGVRVGAGPLCVAHRVTVGVGVLADGVAVPAAAQAVAEEEAEAQGVLERVMMPVELGGGVALSDSGRVAGALALAVALALSCRVAAALLLLEGLPLLLREAATLLDIEWLGAALPVPTSEAVVVGESVDGGEAEAEALALALAWATVTLAGAVELRQLVGVPL